MRILRTRNTVYHTFGAKGLEVPADRVELLAGVTRDFAGLCRFLGADYLCPTDLFSLERSWYCRISDCKEMSLGR